MRTGKENSGADGRTGGGNAALVRFDGARAVRLKAIIDEIITDTQEKEARRIRNRDIDYEIKALGLAPKVFRQAVLLQGASPEKQQEERLLLEQYRELVGMLKAEGLRH